MPARTRKRKSVPSYTALSEEEQEEIREPTPRKKARKMASKKSTVKKPVNRAKNLDCPSKDEDFAPWIMSEMKRFSYLEFPRYKKRNSPKKKKKIVSKKRGKKAAATATEEASSDDDIIEVGTTQLALKCPLTTVKIKYPCRFESCVHNECFDGVSFMSILALKFSKKDVDGMVRCPCCRKVIIRNIFQVPNWKSSGKTLMPVISKMVFDTEINDILQSTIRNKDEAGNPIEHVNIQADGSWQSAEKKKIEQVSIDPIGRLELSELKELTSKYDVSSDDSDLGLNSSSDLDSTLDEDEKENNRPFAKSNLIKSIDRKLKVSTANGEENRYWEQFKNKQDDAPIDLS